MRLENTLTQADLREVLADPPKRRDNILATLVAYTVLFALAVPVAAGTMGTEAPEAIAAAKPQDLWVTLAPSLVGVTLVAGGTLLGRWQARHPGGTRGRQIRATALTVFSFAWMLLPNVPALAIIWHPTHLRLLWAAVAPWFAYGGFACVVGLTRPRHTAAVLWAGQRSLGRPGVVELSDDGVAVTDANVEARCRWQHFVRFRETNSLIVLDTEDGAPLMIAKRALPNPADEDVLRRLIQAHVASGSFLPREVAFPVVPVAGPS